MFPFSLCLHLHTKLSQPHDNTTFTPPTLLHLHATPCPCSFCTSAMHAFMHHHPPSSCMRTTIPFSTSRSPPSCMHAKPSFSLHLTAFMHASNPSYAATLSLCRSMQPPCSLPSSLQPRDYTSTTFSAMHAWPSLLPPFMHARYPHQAVALRCRPSSLPPQRGPSHLPPCCSTQPPCTPSCRDHTRLNPHAALPHRTTYRPTSLPPSPSRPSSRNTPPSHPPPSTVHVSSSSTRGRHPSSILAALTHAHLFLAVKPLHHAPRPRGSFLDNTTPRSLSFFSPSR